MGSVTRRTTISLACAALIALPVAPAMADRSGIQPGKGGTRPAPTAPASGGGQMQVNGAGTVRVTGNFLAWGDVRGMTVRVTDRYGDALVVVGRKRVLRPLQGADGTARRSITLRPGPKQRVRIEGCRATVTFRGTGNIFISVSGEGAVRLDGVGTFRVNGRAERSWPLRARTIPLRPSPPGGRD